MSTKSMQVLLAAGFALGVALATMEQSVDKYGWMLDISVVAGCSHRAGGHKQTEKELLLTAQYQIVTVSLHKNYPKLRI